MNKKIIPLETKAIVLEYVCVCVAPTMHPLLSSYFVNQAFGRLSYENRNIASSLCLF